MVWLSFSLSGLPARITLFRVSKCHPRYITQFFYNSVGVPSLSNDHCGSKIRAGLFCSYNLNIAHLRATIGTKVYLVHLIFLPGHTPSHYPLIPRCSHHFSSSSRARSSTPAPLLSPSYLTPAIAAVPRGLPGATPARSVSATSLLRRQHRQRRHGTARKANRARASRRWRRPRGRLALQFLFSNLTCFLYSFCQ
jgi:hypothetical protein